jgi:hypothetical protein
MFLEATAKNICFLKFYISGLDLYIQHFYMLKLFATQRIVFEILGLICLGDGRLDFEEMEEAEIDMQLAQTLLDLG